MKVQSSTISEINYDGKILTVVFNNGREYIYEGVPAKIYEDFSKAESKGKYFTRTSIIDTIIRESSKKKLKKSFTNDWKYVIIIM